MAADWLTTVFRKRSAKILLLTGAAVGVTVYIIYRIRKLSKEEADFSEEPEQSQETEEDEQRIVVLGLDGAGKTSLLSFMSKHEVVKEPQPTDGFNVMCIHNDHKAVNIWEVGGSANIRAYWGNFLQGTNTLVFVVDSSDKDRIKEAGAALKTVLADEKLRSVPVIIIATKQDLPNPIHKINILDNMGIEDSILEEHTVTVLDAQVPPSGEVKGVDDVKTALLSLSG